MKWIPFAVHSVAARSRLFCSVIPMILVIRTAGGALIPDGANDNAYKAYGAQEQGKVLWLEATTPNGGTEHVSATFLDPWDVLTAAHCVIGQTGEATASTIQIGTGTNYLTDPGQVVGATSFVIDPQYDFTLDSPDLAIIHLAEPLPGTPMQSHRMQCM